MSKTEGLLRFYRFRGNLFARNEVRVSKTEGFWMFLASLVGPAAKRGSSVKN